MPYYQGDMMHCRNEKCADKLLCYRYWLGQRAKFYGGIVTMFTLDEKTNKDKCENFLYIKNY